MQADGVICVDADDRIIMVNSAFTRLTGLSAEEMLGRLLEETPFRPPDPQEYAAADRLEHALHRNARTANRVGLLFLDLDGFKDVNDKFELAEPA